MSAADWLRAGLVALSVLGWVALAYLLAGGCR
jgi:hypothetical protein